MQTFHLQNRPDREIIDDNEITGILNNGKFVSISMCRNNEPYIVTLSYGYSQDSNCLYFHSSTKGLKLDFIKENPNVCATVIEDGGYIPNECAHQYKSVVFWGNMSIVTDLDEKKHGMLTLLNHLEKGPDVIKEMLLKSDASYSRMEILKLEITQIHGKAGR